MAHVHSPKEQRYHDEQFRVYDESQFCNEMYNPIPALNITLKQWTNLRHDERVALIKKKAEELKQ